MIGNFAAVPVPQAIAFEQQLVGLGATIIGTFGPYDEVRFQKTTATHPDALVQCCVTEVVGPFMVIHYET